MQCESIGRVGSSACSCNTLIAHFWSVGSRTCSPRACAWILFKIPAPAVWMVESSRSKEGAAVDFRGAIVTIFDAHQGMRKCETPWRAVKEVFGADLLL